MNESKKRRKEARAQRFQGHETDSAYRTDATAERGREWDSEQGDKPKTNDAGDSIANESGTSKNRP